MKLLVLETIINGRNDLVSKGKQPPFVVHLPPKRMGRLRAELKDLGVPFGLPLSGYVPDPREDGEEYEYLGIVLEDVHVYGRLAGRPPSR